MKLLLLVFQIWFGVNCFSINYDSVYSKAVSLQYSYPDSSIQNFKFCLPYFEAEGDSAKVFNIKLKLIQRYSGNGNYQKAYDEAWNLLPQTEGSTFKEVQIELNQQLGSLYIIFGQYNKAHFYLNQALEQSKKLSNRNIRSNWLTRLYAIKAWLITNQNNDFKEARYLLNLALQENHKLKNSSDIYIQMQLAELYINHDSLLQAEQLLMPWVAATAKKHQSEHSLLYDHVGLLYMKKKQYDSAAIYYHQCIEAIDHYQNHLDNKPKVLDSLASCYQYMGRSDLAFHFLRKSSEVSQLLFGSKNSINKELFEIKNTYEEQLKKQQLALLLQEKNVLRLKTVLYTAILGIIIIGLILLLRLRNRKMESLKQKQKLEKKKQLKNLETKNRELTASTLKLLERDALLNDIRSHLDSMKFKKENQKVISSLVSSIKANKAKNWHEFELHFTSVNNEFYTVLKQNYPQLSSTDLKMCALIKMQLSSKDMADIMGIGVDSVNTSRSRIRKKMQLSREVNLTAFLRSL